MSYSSVVLAEATLIAFYELQETAGSTSAADSKNGLTLNVSAGTYTFGGAGPGGSLATSWVSDGTTGRLVRAVAAASTLDITGAISFDCWGKINGSNSSDYGYFMSRDGSSYAFGTRSSGVLNAHGNGADPDSSTTGVTSGVWKHYGYSISSGGTTTFYVNGVQLGTTVSGAAPVSDAGNLCLGVWDTSPSFFENAAIAGCALYNSVLPGSSFLAHYNALAGGGSTLRSLALTGVGA